MAIIIIIIIAVVYVAFAIYNYMDGRRIDRSARECKAVYDRMYALRRLEKEREERAYQDRLDRERAERIAAEKAAKAERESRPYGTYVHTYGGTMEYSEYRRLSKW